MVEVLLKNNGGVGSSPKTVVNIKSASISKKTLTHKKHARDRHKVLEHHADAVTPHIFASRTSSVIAILGVYESIVYHFYRNHSLGL